MSELRDLRELESLVEAQLGRIGWLATDAEPCQMCAYADDDLPQGWVRISDDQGCYGYGDAQEIADALASLPENSEYGEFPKHLLWSSGLTNDPPQSSRDWPEELIQIWEIESPEDGGNGLSFIRIETNNGVRYAFGVHGLTECTLADAFRYKSWVYA